MGSITSAFLAARFDRLGLEPMGPNGSFYQTFRIVRSALPSPRDNELELMREDGTTMSAQLRDNFVPLRFSASGSVEAEVVFAGYGIHAPKLADDSLNAAFVEHSRIASLTDRSDIPTAYDVLNAVKRFIQTTGDLTDGGQMWNLKHWNKSYDSLAQ